jgi:hypothetical protein
MRSTRWAVYETITWSEHRLTNQDARAAFTQLAQDLRKGLSPVLKVDEPPVACTPGREKEFLIWNLRRNWGIFFHTQGEVPVADLIGILRALLYSIEAHAWNTGASRGYVHFIEGYMRAQGAIVDPSPPS